MAVNLGAFISQFPGRAATSGDRRPGLDRRGLILRLPPGAVRTSYGVRDGAVLRGDGRLTLS
jgi:hypothetical protein